MIIVDTHCHASPYWYEPVESLLFHMDRNRVAHAILVQYMGQTNNQYQFQCIRRYPDRFVSLVLVDAANPDAAEELGRLAGLGARGVRLREDTRSPGDDPLAIWRKAADLGLPISCGGTSAGFASDEFAQLVEQIPGTPIILEHLGSVNHPDGEPAPYPLRRKVFALARFPNVYIKVHGLGEFCARTTPVTEPFPFELPIPPILEMAYEAFGAQRMMWGSDYPPVSRREGYRNALQLTLDQLRTKSEQDRQLIFGGVALDVFGLR
jgi:L-fuconolactonase